MSANSELWGKVIGQPDAVKTLQSMVVAQEVAHAYLFVGPQGLGKINAARALSSDLMCPKGGCGTCAVCQRIRRDTHPDFRVIEPEGLTYNVEQIRTLIHDASLQPMEAPVKIYVLRSVDLFNEAAANAFLKTLEEPAPHVIFILLAHTVEPVLPTLVSRCVTVRFRTLPQAEMVQRLIAKTGCDPEEALQALAASGSVLASAVEYLRSPRRRASRAVTVETYKELFRGDDLDLIEAAARLLVALKGPGEEMAQRQEADLDEQAQLLDPSAIKRLRERNKRKLSAYEKRSVYEALNIFQSLLRDTLSISQGAPELVCNGDAAESMTKLAATVTPAQIAQALEVLDRARRRIGLNIGTQYVLESVLFSLREVFVCPR